VAGVRKGKHVTVTTVRDTWWGSQPRPERPGLVGADPTGPVVGGGLHLRVDSRRVLLHEFRDRRVPKTAPGVAGLHVGGHPLVTSAVDQALFTRRRTDTRFTSRRTLI
jgi:hypothetical protein